MNPIHLLLLLLLACGFFACTTDLAQQTTKILPAPEGKTLDADEFSQLTDIFVDFNVFEEGSLREEEDYGAGDFRLYFDEEGELTFMPLTKGSCLLASEHIDPLTALPARHWASTTALGFTPASADQLNRWLIKNFSNQPSLDLRIALLENGTILFQGVATTAEAAADFPETSWF
ncbi:MAG: hypothetical protein ACI81P_000472 [Neolewinella sp.]|jgi:hypothetical protein